MTILFLIALAAFVVAMGKGVEIMPQPALAFAYVEG
jgi:hypothetical protein